jgi:glucans biosynthesis protein C
MRGLSQRYLRMLWGIAFTFERGRRTTRGVERAAPSNFGDRRADVDSLRVLALALLIVYHVLLIYSGYELWRVSSSYHGYWADYLIAAMTPWRMAAVFFIGGVAVRFMLSRPSYGAFVRERAARLLVAFAFAVVVLVPPQRYVRLDELGGQPDYLNYLLHDAPYATSYLGLHVPQFAHAWFLPYLFAYSVLIGAWWWLAPNSMRKAEGFVAGVPTWGLVLGAMAWFACLDAAVMVEHPYNRMFVNDFSAHAKFLPVFAFGVLVGKSDAFRVGLGRIKWPLWALSAGLLVISASVKWLFLHHFVDEVTWALTRGLYGGAMLFGVVAFAQWALNRPSKALTYASDAILPVYLLHQTVLVLIADAIVSQSWPLPLEFAVILAAASVIPLVIYHALIRRVPWLRFLFGLRSQPRAHVESAPPASPVSPANDAGATAAPHSGTMRSTG